MRQSRTSGSVGGPGRATSLVYPTRGGLAPSGVGGGTGFQVPRYSGGARGGERVVDTTHGVPAASAPDAQSSRVPRPRNRGTYGEPAGNQRSPPAASQAGRHASVRRRTERSEGAPSVRIRSGTPLFCTYVHYPARLESSSGFSSPSSSSGPFCAFVHVCAPRWAQSGAQSAGG